MLAGFLVSHPNIDLDVEEHPSLRILHAVRHGAADIGIISNAVDASDLQTRPFRADPLSVIMPLNHRLDAEPNLRFSQTLDDDFVGLAVNSALAIYLEAQALQIGKRPRIRVRAEGFDAAIRMVSHGAGLSIVPQAAVERWPTVRNFKSVPLSDAWADRQLLLCAVDFAALPGYAQALLEALA